jgi:hypothetical protein
MGEVKRIFNQAKIDRDTDARMVQPGFHRDALNVNVGESEGGDVGAVENLKGNEEVSGQTSIEGTTIGSVRDPNNNRIYWFNKGTTTDAIYEYDEQTGDVNTILKDKVSRPLIKPKCAPDFKVFLDPVPDDTANRSGLNITFTNPLGGCTVPGQFNYDPNAEYNDGSCIPVINGCTDVNANNYNSNANTDNGSCTYTSTIGVTISGDGSFYNSSSPVTLTANVTNANGAFTYLWSTGETTQTISVSGSSNTITGSVTVTDSYGSATDNYSVVFSAAPPTTTLGVSLSNPGGQTNGASVAVTSNVTNALGSITYSWSDGGSSANSTYTGSNTTITKTLTVTDAGRTSPNHQASDTRSVAFSAVQNFDFVGTTADNTGANISAAGGQSFYNRTSSQAINFSSEASLASNYEWVVAPTVSVSGLPSGVTASGISGGGQGTTGPASVAISGNWSGTSDASPTITWNGGSAQVIPAAQHTLNITNGSSGLGSNITTSVASYSVTKNVGTTTGVTFNASCTPASGYEWVTLPSVSSSSLPSGVTLTSTTGSPVGGTGARQVSATGNWSPTSAGTTNASVTWSGGSVQVVPPACNNYQITYSGNNGQLNYTNCTTGNAGTYNLSNSSGTNVITMQSQTFPTQGSGSGYYIYNISQI